MPKIISHEFIKNPLQQSRLNKKSLCDYVINIASGCLHGCTFCYVPSTPSIRTNQERLKQNGVVDPQMDWGQYLFVRDEVAEKLDVVLSRKRVWNVTESGRGVVLLCSGTDPYQNLAVARVTRAVVKVLLKHNKRVRILTRSPLWTNDLDILVHPNITVGMSLPFINDELGRSIEPAAPLTTDRYKALKVGKEAGCRIYVALAPTPSVLVKSDFENHFEILSQLEPEVMFWEPINARGTNGKRMLKAGLEFCRDVMSKKAWATNFLQQWEMVEDAASKSNCSELLHIWPDPQLKGFIEPLMVEKWLYKPTIEQWK